MSDKDTSGLSAREYWSLSALAVASIMLVVINISMAQQNREMRQQVQQRQLFIAKTVPLEKLSKQIVSAVARSAVENQDSALTALLSEQGIELRPSNAATGAQ